MTSTIKVNNIQNQCGANIINENSNTITIGASGDTVALASGASQTGFGRTGTVDWQTGSIKTATFTAVSGEGYFCDTNGGSFEVDLPAGSAGAIVSIQDYRNTFDNNSLTVDPNGSEKINGGNAGDPVTLDTEGQGVTFVYIDSTVGWRSVQDNQFSQQGSNAQFIAATGGTITTVCTNFKVHTFTGPGTFCVSAAGNACGSNTIDYLVIAGGGGTSTSRGGGGGAGGYRFSNGTASGCYSAGPSPLGASALPVAVAGYPVTVGAGGGPSNTTSSPTPGVSGSNSVFAGTTTITSAGGGGGGGGPSPTAQGQNGGSGGGGGAVETPNPGSGNNGTGNTPPVSPPQGNDGAPSGPGSTSAGAVGAGGGGAGAVGNSNPSPPLAGTGGAGLASSITGAAVTRGGGGGGGGQPGGGCGGAGGGGNGAGNPGQNPGCRATDGTANTGGGGGGGADTASTSPCTGASGGSGVVIIRYKFQ